MPDFIRPIARVLIHSDGHVLLAGASDVDFLFLPGGGIEFGEPLAAAALRELEEELGLPNAAVVALKPVGVFEHSWHRDGHVFHEINVVCTADTPTLHNRRPVVSPESHLTLVWWPLSRLGEVDLRPQGFDALIPGWLDAASSGTPFFHSSMTGRSAISAGP